MKQHKQDSLRSAPESERGETGGFASTQELLASLKKAVDEERKKKMERIESLLQEAKKGRSK